MLKLKKIDPNPRRIYNKSNSDIRVKIEFEEKDSSTGICHWNAQEIDRSYVNMRLLNPTGAIYDMSIPFFTFIYQDSFTINSDITEQVGFPLFETYWSEYQKEHYNLPEENIYFDIYADHKDTSLIFSFDPVVLHVVNHSIIFGFDKDNTLCTIHLKNMVFNYGDFLEIVQ